MPPKANPRGAGGKSKPYSRPDPISSGEILSDIFGKKWKLGKSVGVGGFGEIYLASDDISKSVNEKTAQYVVKIEPHTNGPLFVEIAFYIRAAKLEMVEEWRRSHKLDSIGMPHYVASGSHDYRSQRYRFMVIPRFGQDLYKIIQAKPQKRFSCRAVQAVSLQVLDILEYIHAKDFVHGDIKASNLLLGLGKKPQVYLLDYGLAAKYITSNGSHTANSPDARKAHNGTLEYTSRDAHVGTFARRGDLEILGYNMLEWLTGKLPWSNTDPIDQVHKKKIAFMANIQLKNLYPADIPGLDLVEKYLKYVSALGFDEQPNYNRCRDILKVGLPSKPKSLYLDENSAPTPKKRRSPAAKSKFEEAPESVVVVTKKLKLPEEDLAKRPLRNTTKPEKNFNWARLLQSNPEKIIRQTNGNVTPSTTPEVKKLPIYEGPPTPAMLQLLEKKKENLSKTIKIKGSSTDLEEGTGSLTPAMKEILMRARKLRKSKSFGDLRSPRRLRTKVVATSVASSIASSSTRTAPAISSRKKPSVVKELVRPVELAANGQQKQPSPSVEMVEHFSPRQARHLRRNNK